MEFYGKIFIDKKYQSDKSEIRKGELMTIEEIRVIVNEEYERRKEEVISSVITGCKKCVFRISNLERAEAWAKEAEQAVERATAWVEEMALAKRMMERNATEMEEAEAERAALAMDEAVKAVWAEEAEREAKQAAWLVERAASWIALDGGGNNGTTEHPRLSQK
jgi:hypothetical protein